MVKINVLLSDVQANLMFKTHKKNSLKVEEANSAILSLDYSDTSKEQKLPVKISQNYWS